jgi:two-component system, OmpR family, phosphate regulon sensor histidine kinase PhoR
VRRPRLFWRIYATYLVVVLLCTASVGFYAVRSARSFYFAHTERELLARAQLVRADIDARYGTTTGQQLQDFVTSLGRASSTRITVIAAGQSGVTVGTVVADSDVADVSTMANHINGPDYRAEIHTALKGRAGLAIRSSPTLGVDMMYLALPLREGGRIVDVVRVAVPLTAVNEALDALYTRIIVSALLVALFAAVIGLFVSRRISGQMRAIKAGAERIAAGDFSHEVSVPRTEEFAVVAESLNHMASELDDKLRTLTQERNEREALLSSMVEGVLAVDTDERLIAVNAAAARLLDMDPAEAEGRAIQEVVRNPDLQRVVAQTLSGLRAVEADVVMRVGAEDRDLQANGTLLHADHDTESVVGAVVVLNDVTRLKRLEAVRRDFVANVSHELKTPVTSIKGFAETLEDGALDDPEAARRFVHIIAGQADRLNSIIEDLLALSTLEQSQDSPLLQIEETDLCDVVGVALDVCGPKAEAKHVHLRQTCPLSLIAPVSPPLLEQAVVNLIDNAVKYSQEGSTVDVILEETSDELVISVVDTGLGVAREHLPRIFERFYRVDSARSRDLGGTGLGLAIVKHIAQIHGGRVSVDSVVGLGSTFRIHLPRG